MLLLGVGVLVQRYRDEMLDLARLPVDEGVEVDDLGAAHGLDEALDQPRWRRADEVGVGLGQLAERAVGEGDDRGLAVVGAVDRRVEARAGRARSTSASRQEAASV